jgi:DNA-binding MarR family transcriptional regulator
MDRHAERELEILNAVQEEELLTQRVLARRLGVALGLTNLYLRRLIHNGYIKVAEFPRKPAARKRLRYVLTAQGIAEKTRLTFEHAAHSLNLYRRARATLRDSLARLASSGLKRIALYGTGDATELAYLTLRELELEPIGIFDAVGGSRFLGVTVRGARDLLAEDFDGLVLATFEQPDAEIEALVRLGLPREKLVTLSPIPEPSVTQIRTSA